MNVTGNIVKNFTIEEMSNSSASDSVKLVLTERVIKFATMMQEFRTWWNKPMTVNSWYRTKNFNTKCNGDPKSRHIYGEAMDWGQKGLTDSQRRQIMTKWKAICKKYGEIGAINYYTNGIHFEIGSDLSYGNKVFQIRDYRGKQGDW